MLNLLNVLITACVNGVYADMSKAFDCISHKRSCNEREGLRY